MHEIISDRQTNERPDRQTHKLISSWHGIKFRSKCCYMFILAGFPTLQKNVILITTEANSNDSFLPNSILGLLTQTKNLHNSLAWH